ncbi:AAA family ATPase [Paenibacillus lautus]|uniref:AAA family ATPase n=1 Tax=Paenibacillus lautus TaxID=1401 RepID=UPI001596D9F1|nr:AAA family ATPase [Paenibacillus lautus]
MLRFTSLTIENFGPFKGSQTIDLTDEDGVSIIWGNNGRGKTTLLNIFRYALFGKIQNRRGIVKDLYLISNIESRSEDNYGFKVILRMTSEGKNYELTRQYKIRNGVIKPTKNDDYEQVVYLKEDGAILSGAMCDHVLNTIMPEQVSRFFLFDGELLQEYEELLMDHTDAGAKIKESIEKILGVPVLTNGAIDVESVLGDYRTAKTRAAQNNQRTMQIGAKIDVLDAKLQVHRAEFERLRNELSTELNNRNILEDKLQQSERIRGLLADAKALELSIEEKKARREGLLTSISTITKEAWKGLISSRASIELSVIDEQAKELEEKERKQNTAEHFLEEMRQAIEKKHCQLCDQDIKDDLLPYLKERVNRTESDFGGLTFEETRMLHSLRNRKNILMGMIYPSSKEKLEIYEEQLDTVTVEISQAERQLKTVSEDIDRYGDIDGLTELTQQHAQSLAKINNLEEGKRNESAIIAETQSSLATLDGQLNRNASGTGLLLAMRKVELCEQIHKIFEKGIDAYREKLKKDVEQDATAIFLKISNDPDYIKLEINDNYGLNMVHTSGEKVPFRSAGFEHIVALSLISALHKNAPLRGPIIMDSPFGRLDPIHKDKITKALPSMSEQIVLLAYTHEIDEQTARATLGSSLKKEYRLERQTSFFTRIESQ